MKKTIKPTNSGFELPVRNTKDFEESKNSAQDVTNLKDSHSERKEPDYEAKRQDIEEYSSHDANNLHQPFIHTHAPYESPTKYGHYSYLPTQPQNISYSPTRTKQLSEHNPRNPPESIPKYEHTLNHANEEELVDVLKNLLEMEDDLENYRVDLSLKPDFNLLDLFRIFDIENKGYITFEEFRSSLSLFHIYPSYGDALLLFSRYETVSKGILNYSDF